MKPHHDKDPSAEEQYRAALDAVRSPLFLDGLATEKREILWTFISRYPYRLLPPLDTTVLQLLIRLINRPNLRKAFEIDEDIRPPRTKAFHPLGTVAKIRFEAAEDHPFTGIFATGAVGFARLSLAMGEANFGPSTAFKFLIDGPNSAENLVVDQSLDRQTSRDFFERAPTNRTLWPTTYPLKLIWPVVQWWLSAISNPLYQSLNHLAVIESDGKKVDRVRAPELIYFYADDELHNDPHTKQDFREMLGEIPTGSVLYRVFCRPTEASKQIYLGLIRTESDFVASVFGDRILALRHTEQSVNTAPAMRG